MNVHKRQGLWLLLIALFMQPVFSFAAWNEPPLQPVLGNVPTPINVGTATQIKNGDLSVNAFSAILDSYFASKLGVGTSTILATLDVTPTVTSSSDLKNIKSGLVYNGGSTLTNYYASYIAAPSGTGAITNKYALVTEPTAGKVGIGTLTPAAQLSVNGGVQVGDDVSACTNTNVGTMRWHSVAFETCNGTAWVPVAPIVPSNTVTCNTGELCGVAMWENWSSWDGSRSYRCIMASGAVNEMFNCDGGWHGIQGGFPWSNYLIPGVTSVMDVFSCDPGFTFTMLTNNNAYPAATYPSASAIAACLKQ